MIKDILIKDITPDGTPIIQLQCYCCHSNNVNHWVEISFIKISFIIFLCILNIKILFTFS